MATLTHKAAVLNRAHRGQAAPVVLPAPEPHRGYDRVRRVTDIVGGLALFAAFLPLMAAGSIAVAVTTRSWPFYVQKRSGFLGEPFPVLKIKTMRDGSDRAVPAQLNTTGGAAFKAKDDPRITPVGRFLRKTSIDEMPQFLNVIRGEMSLVGPRPLPLHETARCSRPQLVRLAVKPGITCIWQVSGRSDIGFHRWVAMDRMYVRRRSTLYDLGILLRTPWAVLTMRGAH